MTSRLLVIALAVSLFFFASCDTAKNFLLINAKLEYQLDLEANQTKFEFLKKYANDTTFQALLGKKIEEKGYHSDSTSFRKNLLSSVASMYKIHDVNRVATNVGKTIPSGAAFSSPSVSCSATYNNMEKAKKIDKSGLFWLLTNPEYDPRQAYCDLELGGWEKIAVIPKGVLIEKTTFGDELYPNNLLMPSTLTKKDKLAYREAKALVPTANQNLFILKFLDHSTGKAVYLTPNPFDKACTLPKLFDGSCTKNPLIVSTTGDLHAREIKTAWALDRTHDIKQGFNAFVANGADLYVLV